MGDNKKKKSISDKKLFLIAYICVFGFFVLIHLIFELSSGGEDLSFWMVVIIDAVFSFLFVSPFWIMIRSIKKADNIIKQESMSKIDFINNKEYYRDILKNYSIVELSYIDDFNIDYPKDIITTLLSLKLKNKITITNNFVNVIDYYDVGLKKTEKYILECIKDGKVRVKHSHDIVKYVEEEAIEDNLIVEADFNSKSAINNTKLKNFSKVVVFIIIFILFGLAFDMLNKFNISDDIVFILTVMFAFFIMFFFIYISVSSDVMYFYLHKKSKSYVRTDIGEQVNGKIEGLKNYIKDFSVLDKREQNELMIWEDYLIYSILFNQNEKVMNDLSCLVEAEMEDGKVYFEPVDKKSSNNN